MQLCKPVRIVTVIRPMVDMEQRRDVGQLVVVTRQCIVVEAWQTLFTKHLQLIRVQVDLVRMVEFVRRIQELRPVNRVPDVLQFYRQLLIGTSVVSLILVTATCPKVTSSFRTTLQKCASYIAHATVGSTLAHRLEVTAFVVIVMVSTVVLRIVIVHVLVTTTSLVEVVCVTLSTAPKELSYRTLKISMLGVTRTKVPEHCRTITLSLDF
jgi:hypothetical protein